MTRFLLPLVILCCLGACAGTGSSGGSSNRPNAPVAAPMKVRTIDYRIGATFGLINDGTLVELGVEGETPMLRKATFNSRPGQGVNVKVATDEQVAELVKHLERNGFGGNAQRGPAPPPAQGSTRWTTSIEITVGGESRHWLFDTNWATQASLPRVAKDYGECRAVIIAAYNAVPQYASSKAENWTFDGATLKRGN